tara:strand:- start:449 stop:646 length:198 start_codon:yes stop_codon:yes gene_type:complete
MTAFMLACYMGAVAQSSIYFKSVTDCTFYAEHLSDQQLEVENGTKKYNCICKLVPQVDEGKVKVY